MSVRRARLRRLRGGIAALALIGGCGQQDGALSPNQVVTEKLPAAPASSPSSAADESSDGLGSEGRERGDQARPVSPFFHGAWIAEVEAPSTGDQRRKRSAGEAAGPRRPAPVRQILRGISMSFKPSARDSKTGTIRLTVNGREQTGTYTAEGLDAQRVRITADFGDGREVFDVRAESRGRSRLIVQVGDDAADSLTLIESKSAQ